MKKELTPSQSIKKVKDLLKSKIKLTKNSFRPGSLLMYHYNAKDKNAKYDRTPLVLVLRTGSIHTMCLNFHWLPISMRVNLIRVILKMNKSNIKNNRPLDFSYTELKPMLKKLGYAPVIRLYINSRISSSGVVVPSDRLIEIAKLKTETFTGGKYSAETLYKKARKK